MNPTAMDGADRFTSPDYTAQAPALRQDTVELLAAVTQAAKQPVVVFTGGQPGAGKTRSIVEPLEKRFAQEGGIAVIDPDLLRPLFARAQEEMRTTGVFSDEAYRAAGTLAYDVSLGLADQSRNVLRDGTLANARYPLMEIDQLHERGYRVEVHVAAVYEGLSRARTIERRESEAVLSETGFGRDVPPCVPRSGGYRRRRERSHLVGQPEDRADGDLRSHRRCRDRPYARRRWALADAGRPSP